MLRDAIGRRVLQSAESGRFEAHRGCGVDQSRRMLLPFADRLQLAKTELPEPVDFNAMVWIWMDIYMFICRCVFILEYVYVNLYVYVYMYVYVYLYVYVKLHVYVCQNRNS